MYCGNPTQVFQGLFNTAPTSARIVRGRRKWPGGGSPRMTLNFPNFYRMDEDAVGPRQKHKVDQLRARLCMEKVRKPCV